MRLLAITPIVVDDAELARRQARYDDLAPDGVTVVLTTHHMDEAERLADHIHILDRGRIVAAGTASELTKGGRTLEDVFLDLTTRGPG